MNFEIRSDFYRVVTLSPDLVLEVFASFILCHV